MVRKSLSPGEFDESCLAHPCLSGLPGLVFWVRRVAMYYQQGDVLIEAITVVPDGGEKLSNRIVLAEGEATGHAHVMTGKGLKGVAVGGDIYLTVKQPSEVTHEEHGTILVQPGTYRVRKVREYDHFEEEARDVAD